MKKFLMFGVIICASVGSYASHIVVNSPISSNTTWTAANTYSLDGLIVVDSGVTLTIAPGTKICSGTGSGLVIQSTAKLIANGTEDSMIVFTSDKAPNAKNPGDWMGILWLGDAVNNDGIGITKKFGGENFVANGSDDNYNGGSMRYTIIEYAGQTVLGDDVKGGLITQSLGTGTTIDHIQFLNSASNGMLINGGIYSASDLYFQNNYERGVYIAEGNRSTLTEVLVVKSPATLATLPTLPLNTIGIEIVNNDNPLVTPLTHPIIDGYTCIGPNHCGSITGDASIGMLFDLNGGGDFKNGVVSGFETGLLLNDDLSMIRTDNSTLTFNYCAVVLNSTNLLNNPSSWNGCSVTPNIIDSWFINGCGTTNNQLGNSIQLDYDLTICNDYCDNTPVFKVGLESEIEEGDKENVLRGVLQLEGSFEWVQTCPQYACDMPDAKAKQSLPLEVYPNPSNEQVIVRLPKELSQATKLQVVDMVTGHQYTYTIAPNTAAYHLDISQWSSGFYKIYIVDASVMYEGKLQVMPQ